MTFYAQRQCDDHGNVRHQEEHMQSSDTSTYSVTSNLSHPQFKYFGWSIDNQLNQPNQYWLSITQPMYDEVD